MSLASEVSKIKRFPKTSISFLTCSSNAQTFARLRIKLDLEPVRGGGSLDVYTSHLGLKSRPHVDWRTSVPKFSNPWLKFSHERAQTCSHCPFYRPFDARHCKFVTRRISFVGNSG